MISYNIEANPDDIREAQSLFEFVGGNSREAVRVAINRSAPRVRTKASQAIRSQVRLKAAYVNSRLTIRRAARDRLNGAISTPSRGLLLSLYSTDASVSSEKISWFRPPEVPKRGIRVKVKPSGATKSVSGAPGETKGKPFYLILPNSRRVAIAARRATPGPKGGNLKVFNAPSLSQVFNTVRDDVLPEASDIYQAQLLDAMRFLLAKKFPKE